MIWNHKYKTIDLRLQKQVNINPTHLSTILLLYSRPDNIILAYLTFGILLKAESLSISHKAEGRKSEDQAWFAFGTYGSDDASN